MLCLNRPQMWVLRIICIVVFGGMFLSACSVPDYMGVRSGLHPDNQDEQVRFRTTYYFRVKDPCKKGNPLQDSLYRFRMTGKASALVTKIHFESGTLDKKQIDPFGVAIDYKGEKETADAKDKKEAGSEKNGKEQIEEECSEGGFQIYGHQGWTTFDQDERLLMAMTTSAEPLISVLQEYSARILGTQKDVVDEKIILPLVREQLRLSRAELALGTKKPDQTAKTLIDDVITAFGEGK